MEDRPQTTDQIKHRPSTRPSTTDQSPRNVAKVRKQQNIHLFSIALVDFCDNFTSNTASPAVPGGGTLSVYVCIKKIGVYVCGGGGGTS